MKAKAVCIHNTSNTSAVEEPTLSCAEPEAVKDCCLDE